MLRFCFSDALLQLKIASAATGYIESSVEVQSIAARVPDERRRVRTNVDIVVVVVTIFFGTIVRFFKYFATRSQQQYVREQGT